MATCTPPTGRAVREGTHLAGPEVEGRARRLALELHNRAAADRVVDRPAVRSETEIGGRRLDREMPAFAFVPRGVDCEIVFDVALGLTRQDDLRVVAIDDRPDAGLRQLGPERVGQRLGGAEEQAGGPQPQRRLVIAGRPDPLDFLIAVDGRGTGLLGPLDLHLAVVGHEDQTTLRGEIFQHRGDLRIEIVDARQDDRLVPGGKRAVEHVFLDHRGQPDVEHLAGEVEAQAAGHASIRRPR